MSLFEFTLAVINGTLALHFDRESESLQAAIRSAIQQIKGVGLKVARVELEPDSVLQSV